MKYTKLPSGSYRCRRMINGKSYSLTFDHKPTKQEVDEAFIQKTGLKNGKMTFQNACESYINARSNTLSPTTYREYTSTIARLSTNILALPVDDITTLHVQKEINRLSVGRAPKTVRNYHGFISAVLGEFRPELVLRTNLPMKDKVEPYIPNKEDIKALLEEASNTPFEVPILLGCCSLRRSEICALEPSDIEGNIIHIRKAMVMDSNKEWVIKKPKNTGSIRDVIVPDQVIEAINRNGLYKGHPNQITDWMTSAEKKLGIQHFSLHKCRHYFASAAHEAGVSDADIMAAGGWKTDHVMKTVYRHSLANNTSAATSAVIDGLF